MGSRLQLGGYTRGCHMRVDHAARSAAFVLIPVGAGNAFSASPGQPGDALLTEVTGIHVLPGKKGYQVIPGELQASETAGDFGAAELSYPTRAISMTVPDRVIRNRG
jgi:hypothetical protein